MWLLPYDETYLKWSPAGSMCTAAPRVPSAARHPGHEQLPSCRLPSPFRFCVPFTYSVQLPMICNPALQNNEHRRGWERGRDPACFSIVKIQALFLNTLPPLGLVCHTQIVPCLWIKRISGFCSFLPEK